MASKKPSGRSNAGNAAKAYRLRKREAAGETLDPVDKLWLVDYGDKQQQAKEERGQRRKRLTSKDIGASASERTIKLDLREKHEAAGTGAAAAAAVAALEEREAGRRLDYLTSSAVDAMKESRRELVEAVHVYRSIALSLRQRTEVLESTHVELLRAVHGAYGQATSLEMQLLREREQQGGAANDPAQVLLAQLLAKRMGVTLPGIESPTGFPPSNGTRRKPGH